MNWLRRSSSEPLWKEEFSVRTADERYVTRRQLTKFLVLASFGMFVGNLWILVRSMFYRVPSYPQLPVVRVGEIPVGEVRLFTYPTNDDHCILVRTSENEYVSYSQKCTHLSCAVYYSQENNRLECPCHKGFFSIADGSVLQGPPSRPLPKIVLESRGGVLVAVDIKTS
jgi:Rieske Fe-S protein